jgi:hypothetical protein
MFKIMTNDQVVKAWAAGNTARNHRNTLIADGAGALFSYGLKIGQRSHAGVCIVGDYTAGGGGYHSQTTSCHVGRAKRVPGACVMHTKVWEASPFSFEMPF